MSKRYDYFAFISYTDEDTEKAQWMKRKLTHYRFPADIREERNDLPSWIRPVFEWKTDTSGGDMRGSESQIQNALFNSKYLIVICSTHAVKSEPVNGEIQDFINWGREKNIIPFIISGKPHAENPEEECFPPALLGLTGNRERKGIFIDNVNEDYAAVAVISTMFEIKVNDLWKPYEREQKRMRNLRLGGTLLLAVIGFVVASIFIHLNRELNKVNIVAVAERNRANEEAVLATKERMKAEAVSESLYIANDKILRQNALIQYHEREIEIEKNNAIDAKHSLEISMSRIYAGKALDLVSEGDSYLARYYALHALPPYLPYTIEAEIALRESMIEENAILRGHKNKVKYALFSPSGKRILTNDNTLRIWDAESGQCIKILEENFDNSNVEFSPDGKHFATTSSDKTIHIWDLEKGVCVKKLKGHTDVINSISFSLDGKKIASASSDKTIRIWSVESGCCLHTLKGHNDKINFVVFHPYKSILLSSSSDKTIGIWDSGNGMCIDTLVGHRNVVLSAIFSPDGNKILSTSPEDVYVWDIKKKVGVRILEENCAEVLFAEFSPDGKKIMTVLSDYVTDAMMATQYNRRSKIPELRSLKTTYNVMRLWNTDTGKCIKTINNVYFATFSPDGRKIVSVSDDSTISIWDSITGECVNTQKKHSDKVNSVMFSYDGNRILSASSDHTVRIWDVGTNLCANSDIINSATISIDGTGFLTVSDIGNVKIWNSDTGKYRQSLNMKSLYLDKALCYDGKRVLLAPSNNIMRIIDPSTGWEIQALNVQNRNIIYAGFDYYGKKIVTTSNDNLICIWDIETGLLLHTMEGHSKKINSAVFSRDGKKLLSASSDCTARIWDVKNKKSIHTLIGHDDNVLFAIFSRDGKLAVTTSKDHTARIWKVENAECIHTLLGHSNDVNSAAFSCDGKMVVTASSDKTLRIWDIDSGKCVQTIKGHNDVIKSVAFTQDGKKIVSASSDNTVRIWDVPPLENLIEDASKKFIVSYN